MNSNNENNNIWSSMIDMGKKGIHIGNNAAKMAIDKVRNPEFQDNVKGKVINVGSKIKEVNLSGGCSWN